MIISLGVTDQMAGPIRRGVEASDSETLSSTDPTPRTASISLTKKPHHRKQKTHLSHGLHTSKENHLDVKDVAGAFICIEIVGKLECHKLEEFVIYPDHIKCKDQCLVIYVEYDETINGKVKNFEHEACLFENMTVSSETPHGTSDCKKIRRCAFIYQISSDLGINDSLNFKYLKTAINSIVQIHILFLKISYQSFYFPYLHRWQD